MTQETIANVHKENFTDSKNEETAKKVLEKKGISKEGVNITPIDLFYVPENLNHEEKLNIIAKNLSIPKENLSARLEEISHYWREAKSFYKNFLIPRGKDEAAFPKEIERLDGFNNLEELLKTLEKTTQLKKESKFGMSPFYCALASLMIAEREYAKEEFEGLINESRYLSKKLFQPGKDGITRFHNFQDEDEEWSRLGIMLKENSWINARYSYRGKTKNSSIMKLASKPESSVQEIIKDGIGLRFEMEKIQDAIKFFEFICPYLIENFKAKEIVLENVRLLNDNEGEELFKILQKYGIDYESDENPSSHKNFKTVKIRGTLNLPLNGEEENMTFARNFELQVVLADNENESGLTQSKIYKTVQKLSLFTRLFGSFGEEYLDLVCNEASLASGLSKEKIKEHILRDYVAQTFSVRSKKVKYASVDQLKRWMKAGILPKGIKIKESDRQRFNLPTSNPTD